MPNKASKIQNYLSLFVPSPVGMVFYVSLSAIVIILHQIEGIREFLRLPDGTAIWRFAGKAAENGLINVLGESKTNVLVVGAFWAIVGLAVYMFLRGLARYIAELDDDVEVRRYVWPKGADRNRPLRVMMERTAFRALALVGLILFVSGPLSSVVKGPILVDLLGSNVILQYVVWFVASLLAWHICVVLLRLVLLRPRVIGEY